MPAAPIATPAYSDNYLPHFDRLHTTDADQRSKKSDADADADAEVEQRNDAFDDIKQPWWRDAGLRRLNLAIAVCFLAATTNGYDGALINGLQSLPQFYENLGYPGASLHGLIIAGISLGGTPSFLPAAWLSDRIGRRWTAGLGALLMAAASLAQAFTRGPYAFLVTRILLGVGLAGTQTASAPLVNELAHPRHRALAGAGYNASYYVGSITSAWTIFATLVTMGPHNWWAWRIPCIVQAVMPLAQVIGTILIVPESPRWLIAQGREAEALRILVKYHANGRSDDPLVQHEFCEIFEAIKLDQRAQSKSGYLDFFRTPGNRWRLGIIVAVGLMVQWAGNGIISYYLSPILGTLGVTSPVQQDALNGGLQIWNSIFALVGALLAERLGRRQLWLLSAIGMLISEIGVTIGSAVFSRSNIKGAGYAAVVFFFTFFGSYCLAFTPLNFLYIVEILPYRLRARGLALNQMIVFGSGFFNQYVSPIALASIRWHFYLIYIILLLIFIAVIYLTFPETSGLTLEEIESIFDGARPSHSHSHPLRTEHHDPTQQSAQAEDHHGIPPPDVEKIARPEKTSPFGKGVTVVAP